VQTHSSQLLLPGKLNAFTREVSEFSTSSQHANTLSLADSALEQKLACMEDLLSISASLLKDVERSSSLPSRKRMRLDNEAAQSTIDGGCHLDNFESISSFDCSRSHVFPGENASEVFKEDIQLLLARIKRYLK
jgi:hypothetical protein